MPTPSKYRKRNDQLITAVRLDLDTEGFTYKKWGGEQRCRRGDWLVNNSGDIYTVAGGVFLATYREVSPGVYEKHAPVWAYRAEAAGVVKTLEGETHYEAGDYIVANDEDGSNAWAVTAKKFEEIYEVDD